MDIKNELTGYPAIDRPWMKYYGAYAHDEPVPECSVYEYMANQNSDNQDGYALNFYGKKYTYGELFREIDRVAAAFTALGVKCGDVVAVVTVSCVQSVLCFYALNKIGAVSNFLNVLASAEDIRHFIEEGKTKVVVSLDLFGAKVAAAVENSCAEKVVVYSMASYMPAATKLFYSLKMRKFDFSFMQNCKFLTWDAFLAGGKDLVVTTEKCPEDICYYGHTGGTTGFPKSVLLTNHSFNSVVWNYVHQLQREKGDAFLNVIVPFVTYGAVVNMHMPLCAGMELVLIPKFNADEWPAYMKKYKPAHIIAIPAYVAPLAECEKLRNADLSFVKTIGMGGEGMNVPLERRLNDFMIAHGSKAALLKGYGMTEVGGTASVENNNVIKEGSVGIPLMGNCFMIYDNEAQSELPYRQSGEICMQCVSVMAGYKDNEEETAALIKTHPDGSRWIHTGDIGFIDEDGFIFVEGRMKRMIMTVLDGMVYKVIPSQTEAVLNGHAAVKDSCVVGCKNGNDILLKAYLILSDEKKDVGKLKQELQSVCTESLGENQRPFAYEVLKDFPRTAAGKVDYRKLEAESEIN